LQRATLVATLTHPPEPGELEALPEAVEWLELRADLAGELDPEELRRRAPGKLLLYTLRSVAEGGDFAGSPADRLARLRRVATAGGWDAIDLEGERDLEDELLAVVPPQLRLLSWHGPPTPLAELEERLASLLATPAARYKLVPHAIQPGEALAPLKLLFQSRRDDVIAFASGAAGTWTRFVAPYLGSPWVYGSATEDPAAAGQLPVARLVEDFGLPALRPLQGLSGVVGKPALHSLSPRLHNACYRALDLPLLYLPFEAEGLGDFWLEVVEDGALEDFGMPLRGLSVTAPFKASAVAVAGALSPLAERLSAVNTLVLRAPVWEGENTDCEGVVLSLGWHGVPLAHTRTLVIGAGGAGKATAFALAMAGCEVTLANRSVEAGEAVAAELDLPFLPFADLDARGFELVVNAAALGRRAEDPLPVDPDTLEPGAVLVDLVYGRTATALGAAAAARGLRVIDGREVLLGQALSQFRLMTGHDLPLAVGRAALGLEPRP
jgi:3-dehydroquinate dehydratase / shikimate dehydrogenase